MSDAIKTSIITQENEAFALMGRLHVVLRREIGRVIDIKYMAINPQYCRHVLDFAAELHKPDIDTIVQKLQHLYFDAHGLFEFTAAKERNTKRATTAVTASKTAPAKLATPKPLNGTLAASDVAALSMLENEEVTSAYVGRLR